MLEVSYSATHVVFVNPKNSKSEKLALMDAMDTNEAIRAIVSEQKAAVSASRGAVSLLAAILDNRRLDGYKGQTPINEKIPKELKEAIREMEVEYLKPAFESLHTSKGAKPATVQKLWDAYAKELRSGGSYAVAKGKVTAYFAHCGELPTHDGKLLSVAAVDKLLANAKEAAGKPAEQGISGILRDLAEKVEKRSESTKLGDVGAAVHALKAMLATYESMLREEGQAALVKYENTNTGDVTQAAKAVIVKAAASKKGKHNPTMESVEREAAKDIDPALI